MMEANAQPKFLYRVAEHLLQRFDGNLEGVAIVFNNKRPALFLKKHLFELNGKPLWSPQFFTIQQFFEKISGLSVASSFKQFFTLFEEYNKLLQAEGKEPDDAASFYTLSEVILSDFSQIDYYLADPSKIFSLIGDMAELQQQFPGFDDEQLAFMESFWSSFSAGRQDEMQQRFIELWRRMPQLYQNFQAALSNAGLVSGAGMYRQTAENETGLAGFKHVVFVGFNALSRAEEKLFKVWQDAGSASFYFDADSHYLDDEFQEAGYFIRRNLRKIGLINQLEENRHSVNDPLKQVVLVRTLGAISQGKILQELITISSSDEPSKRAIILADEGLLLPVLQAVPGDNLNVTMGYPFKQSAVFGLCDLWLTVQEELIPDQKKSKAGVPYRHVLACLFHPLLSNDLAGRDALYNSIIEKRIGEVSFQELWPLGKEATLLFTPAGEGVAAIEQLKNLLSVIAQSNTEIRWIEKRLIAEVLKALNVLADNLLALSETQQAHLHLKFLFRTLRRSLEGLSVPFEGEPLSGLQVMGLLESRCLDFDEVIIVGMNEGVLPKISKSPSFIPDSVRKAFGLPVLENQNAIFAYFFYRLLHCARKVTLIYNCVTDESGNNGEESRFIKQLRFETNCSFTERTQQNQPVEVAGVHPILVEKSGTVWNRLQRYFNSKGGPMEEKISASAFTDYISCPLKFFFSKIAGLKEPADLPDQIEANMIGSVLHRLMERVYEDLKGVPVSAEMIRKKEALLPGLSLAAFSEEFYRKTDTAILQPNALQQIVLKVLELYALNILRHDEELAPFTIRELENKSDYKWQMEVRVGEYSQKVWLYGIIDRVDIHQGKTRIVDYKTGKDKIVFRDFQSLFDEEGKHQNKALLQTLFYTYVYEKVNGVNGVEPRLYTVRSFKEDTVFKGTGSVYLQDENLEEYKARFEEKLREKLNELFDSTIPFRQTTNLETCKYCQFNGICQR